MHRTKRLLLTAAPAFTLALLVFTPSAAQARPVQERPPAAPPQNAASEDDLARGKRLLAAGDASAAAAALKSAAEGRKTDADAWYYYGLALTRSRRAKDARKAFEQAVKLRPDSAEGHTGLAYALLMLDKLSDAETHARRALSSAPRHADARYILGVIRFREEKFEAALEEAEAALRDNPDSAAAAYLAGDALLNAYFSEGERQAQLSSAGIGPYERRLAMEKREPALAPFRQRMLALAGRLEALAAAQPGSPEAAVWREQAETLRIYGRPPAAGGDPGILRQNEVTTKAVIHFKPTPGFTEEARRNNVSGTVRLRAVLGADGRVRNIVPVRRLPDGLTEVCVAAARQIRFTPATLDGRPVSQFVMLEYNFNVR